MRDNSHLPDALLFAYFFHLCHPSDHSHSTILIGLQPNRKRCLHKSEYLIHRLLWWCYFLKGDLVRQGNRGNLPVVVKLIEQGEVHMLVFGYFLTDGLWDIADHAEYFWELWDYYYFNFLPIENYVTSFECPVQRRNKYHLNVLFLVSVSGNPRLLSAQLGEVCVNQAFIELELLRFLAVNVIVLLCKLLKPKVELRFAMPDRETPYIIFYTVVNVYAVVGMFAPSLDEVFTLFRLDLGWMEESTATAEPALPSQVILTNCIFLLHCWE